MRIPPPPPSARTEVVYLYLMLSVIEVNYLVHFTIDTLRRLLSVSLLVYTYLEPVSFQAGIVAALAHELKCLILFDRICKAS